MLSDQADKCSASILSSLNVLFLNKALASGRNLGGNVQFRKSEALTSGPEWPCDPGQIPLPSLGLGRGLSTDVGAGGALLGR